jgi:hypothetical protein
MHLPTHVLSGWCAANVLPLTPRQRLSCMIAATLPDFDGLGILLKPFGQLGQNLYWDLHHVLGHNIIFGVLMAIGLAMWSSRWLWTFPLYLALFHLHLLMDYYGSGEGWALYYLWPVTRDAWIRADAWAFLSWQNLLALGLLTAWALAIARFQLRTPLEVIAPRLDRKVVNWLRRTGSQDQTVSAQPSGTPREVTRTHSFPER